MFPNDGSMPGFGKNLSQNPGVIGGSAPPSLKKAAASTDPKKKWMRRI